MDTTRTCMGAATATAAAEAAVGPLIARDARGHATMRPMSARPEA